jgi:hypothetical protein
MNCCVVPLVMLGLDGSTLIVFKGGAVTMSTVEPVTPFSLALIVALPTDAAVAKPAVVIVATEVVSEAQVTWLVRSCVELSE